jgi:tricarballylate dehydrogenase
MRSHGVHFQPSLSGALHTARTNAFFMGGGKALVNAYYRSAERLGVQVRYEAPVDRWSCGRPLRGGASSGRRAHRGAQLRAGRRRLRVQPRMAARSLGPERTRRVAGRQLPDPRHALQPGRAAAPPAGPGRRRDRRPDAGAHGGHRRARAAVRRRHLHPHRLRLAGRGGQPRSRRFYDEGEDFWPKRYAIWGRLVAQQPGQIGYSIIDAKAIGRFMPPVFPGVTGRHAARAGAPLGLDEARFMQTLNAYNAACRPGTSTTPRWTTATPKA